MAKLPLALATLFGYHFVFPTAAGLTQSVERLTAEREVAGSIDHSRGRTNTQGLKIPGEVLKEFLGGDVPLGLWNP